MSTLHLAVAEALEDGLDPEEIRRQVEEVLADAVRYPRDVWPAILEPWRR